MKQIEISEFQTNCLKLIEKVRQTKEPIRIVSRGTAIAELVPVPTVQNRLSWIGSMKRSTKILGDIVSPANSQNEWEALRD